jgi:dihydrofolate reductase
VRERQVKGNVVLSISMSLDGFVAGPNVGADHPMGVGDLRLHRWLLGDAANKVDGPMLQGSFETTGSVVLGRRTFDVGVGI